VYATCGCGGGAAAADLCVLTNPLCRSHRGRPRPQDVSAAARNLALGRSCRYFRQRGESVRAEDGPANRGFCEPLWANNTSLGAMRAQPERKVTSVRARAQGSRGPRRREVPTRAWSLPFISPNVHVYGKAYWHSRRLWCGSTLPPRRTSSRPRTSGIPPGSAQADAPAAVTTMRCLTVPRRSWLAPQVATTAAAAFMMVLTGALSPPLGAVAKAFPGPPDGASKRFDNFATFQCIENRPAKDGRRGIVFAKSGDDEEVFQALGEGTCAMPLENLSSSTPSRRPSTTWRSLATLASSVPIGFSTTGGWPGRHGSPAASGFGRLTGAATRGCLTS